MKTTPKNAIEMFELMKIANDQMKAIQKEQKRLENQMYIKKFELEMVFATIKKSMFEYYEENLLDYEEVVELDFDK